MYEPRDRSGPMDVDPVHPLGRAVQYALANDDGPARKRPHSSLAPQPFTVHASSSAPYKFGPDTPFLFHAPPLPPAPKFEPYDPNRWARTDFGFGSQAGQGHSLADVDMAEGDAPGAAPAAQVPASPKAKPEQKVAKAPKPAAVKDEDEEEEDAEPSSPGRKIATGALTRVRRRRRHWSRRRRDSDDEDDYHEPTALSTQAREHHYNLHMSAPAVHHSEIPAILLGYVQFVFNASLVLGFLYVAVQFILAVRRDVKERIEEYSVEILQEIAGCTQAYLANRCEPQLRVPAMEAACSAWELCMNRDPTVVGRARVGAETFAGVINSFVDPISWKTMGFTVVTLTLLIILSNSALLNLRAKYSHTPPPPPPQQYPPWMQQGMGQGQGMGMGQMGLGMGQQAGMGLPAPAPEPSTMSKALGWLGKS